MPGSFDDLFAGDNLYNWKSGDPGYPGSPQEGLTKPFNISGTGP